jgi:membrane-associated protein
MRYPRFFLYNCVGAVAWVAICLWSGYFFGALPWVTAHFELVVLAIVFISVLPMVVELLLAWRQRAVLARTVAATQAVEEAPVEPQEAMR